MTNELESLQLSIDPVTSTHALRDCVQRALSPRRAQFPAVLAAACVASAAPLTLAAAFPPVIPLASLYPAAGGDGSQGFVLTGINEDDSSGESVSGAGDLNGDGIADLVIGAGNASYTRTHIGQTYVVFGSTQGFEALMPLANLLPSGGGDGSRGFVLTGIREGDRSGNSVGVAGDVNGDGVDDLVIGASLASPGGVFRAGESYVVFGSTQAFSAVFPLETLYPSFGGDGSRGFVLTGIDANDSSGFSVSAAGDVNGDGVGDLIIGAYSADPGGRSRAGESYIAFGSSQGFPAVFPLETLYPSFGGDGSRGFVLPGRDASDLAGLSVSAAGDINADGIDDLIIGARDANPHGNSNAGESYVVFGSTQSFAAVFALASLYPAGGGDGSRGFVLTGIEQDGNLGTSVSRAGDVNGDDIDDLIVSAEDEGPHGAGGAGKSYVVFGSTQGFPAIVPLANLYPRRGGDGSRGFVLVGININDNSGRSVSAAGDINADGIDDVIVGAPGGDPGIGSAAGESYVVFGSTQGFPAAFPLARLFAARGGDGSRGFVLTGVDDSDFSGESVSAAGDVNGDGIDDVIIGARGADPNRVDSAGASYVVFGRSAAQ